MKRATAISFAAISIVSACHSGQVSPKRHSSVGLTQRSVVIPKPKTADVIQESKPLTIQDLSGTWQVSLSLPPAKFITELKTDGTYSGNHRTGKWWITKDRLVTLQGFDGGSDYTFHVVSSKGLSNNFPDGFVFSR
jgi:hypothetical protein